MAVDIKKTHSVPSPADVHEMGKKLANDLLQKAEGADSGASTLQQVTAAAMPDFSRATAAIDEETGKPILSGQTIQPTREEMHPEGGQIPSSTAQLDRAVAEIEGRAVPERDERTGQFKADKPAPTPEEQQIASDESAAAALRAQRKETAAPAPAAQAADDYEDVSYTDDDTGDTFVVRAPKAVAKRVQQGYARRSAMHRSGTFLGEARPVLEPLINDGRMRQILPLIQRATQDEEFGNFVIEAYNRRVTGMPLREAQAPVAAAPAPAPAAPAYDAALALDPNEDPYLAQTLGRVLTPLQQQIAAMAADREVERKAQAEREQRELAQRRIQEQSNATVAGMHRELAQMYPNEWTGDVVRDDQLIRRTLAYANRSGLLQRWGASVPTLVLAYEQLRDERLAAAGSPAVAAIQDAERSAAQRVAASNATTPAGAARVTTAPAKKAMPKLPPTRQNGQQTDIKEFMRQAVARVAVQADGM
jgi:hypothetical protein